MAYHSETCDILGPLTSDQIDGQSVHLLATIFMRKSTILIKYKEAAISDGDLCGEGLGLMFNFHPALEFNLHFHTCDADIVHIAVGTRLLVGFTIWPAHFILIILMGPALYSLLVQIFNLASYNITRH